MLVKVHFNGDRVFIAWKADGTNDENLLIIRDAPGLASAYATNITSVYNQYRWRFNRLKKVPSTSWDGLKDNTQLAALALERCGTGQVVPRDRLLDGRLTRLGLARVDSGRPTRTPAALAFEADSATDNRIRHGSAIAVDRPCLPRLAKRRPTYQC